MRVHRGLLGWGVFFLVLGSVPLLVQAGAVDESVLARAWQLWPFLLIGAGLGLVLARTRAAALGGLVVAVTLGLMGGSLLATGIEGASFGFTACSGAGDGTPFAEQRGSFGSEARVTIDLDCGSVDVAAVDGDGWSIRGESPDGRAPDVDAGADSLAVRGLDRAGPGITFGTADGVAWRMELPRTTRTALDLSVNAGSSEVALGGMRLGDVGVDVNAGSARIDLSGASEAGRFDGTVNAGSLTVLLPAVTMSASLDTNAGSVELCVPDDVDLRIRLEDNALASNNFAEAGLEQLGDVWVREGATGTTITVDASANLGSISLNPGDGCE